MSIPLHVIFQSSPRRRGNRIIKCLFNVQSRPLTKSLTRNHQQRFFQLVFIRLLVLPFPPCHYLGQNKIPPKWPTTSPVRGFIISVVSVLSQPPHLLPPTLTAHLLYSQSTLHSTPLTFQPPPITVLFRSNSARAKRRTTCSLSSLWQRLFLLWKTFLWKQWWRERKREKPSGRINRNCAKRTRRSSRRSGTKPSRNVINLMSNAEYFSLLTRTFICATTIGFIRSCCWCSC